MEGFKEYQSKPITRLAYRITGQEALTPMGNGTYTLSTPAGGVTFKAYETILPGDYIVHLSDNDVYHCRQAVFLERNIVE